MCLWKKNLKLDCEKKKFEQVSLQKINEWCLRKRNKFEQVTLQKKNQHVMFVKKNKFEQVLLQKKKQRVMFVKTLSKYWFISFRFFCLKWSKESIVTLCKIKFRSWKKVYRPLCTIINNAFLVRVTKNAVCLREKEKQCILYLKLLVRVDAFDNVCIRKGITCLNALITYSLNRWGCKHKTGCLIDWDVAVICVCGFVYANAKVIFFML